MNSESFNSVPPFNNDGAIFMSSKRTIENCKVGLLDVPYDGTSCFRPGSKFGPSAIRESSNGIDWVKATKDDSYDVIIVDGADPVGPAKELFSDSFLKNCKRILKPGGIFATQSESPEAFHEAHINIVNLLRKIFDFADPLYGSVPIYPSGWWSWTFASMKEANYFHPIESRIIEISKDCQIWSKKWQKGAFSAMPAYIERELIK